MMRRTEKAGAGVLWVSVLLLSCMPAGQASSGISASTVGTTTQALSTVPMIGAERGLDEPILSGLRDDVEHMALAGSDSGYLGAWEQNGDIYAARLTRQGEVLDAFPLRVGASGHDELSPAVGSDGTNYLVCWHLAEKLYCSRVSAAGEVQETPTLVAANAYAEIPVSIAATDGVYLVTSGSVSGGLFVEARRVRADTGELLDTAALATYEQASSPAVAARDGLFLLSFRDRRSGNWDVFGARISSQGEVHDEVPFAICQGDGNQQLPAVASDGTDFLVSFVDDTSTLEGAYGDFRAVVVRADGTVPQPCGQPVAPRNHFRDWAASVAFTGAGYTMAWETYTSWGRRDVLAARLDASGALLGSISEIDRGQHDAWAPVVAASAAVPMVGFLHEATSAFGPTFKAVRLGTEGEALDQPSLRVTASANQHSTPAAARVGGHYLATWHDTRSEGFTSRVFGARVDVKTGEVLDPNGLSLLADGAKATESDLAAAEAAYLYAYVDQASGNTVHAQRLGLDGQRLGEPLALSTTSSRVAKVASNGSTFLVVWLEQQDGATVLRGRRVSAADGSVLDAAPLPISLEMPLAGLTEHNLDVASDGTHFLVVWMGRASGEPTRIYGQRIRGNDGARLYARDLLLTTSGGPYSYPTVTFGAGHYLVTYAILDTTGEAEDTSMALRVAPDGTVRDPLGFQVGTGGSIRSVAWDGRSFALLLVRNGWTAELGFRGLALAELGADGRPLAEVEFTPTASGFSALACDDAGMSRGDCLSIYLRNAGGVPRVHSRPISFNAPPVAHPLEVETTEDAPVEVTLGSADPDGDSLAYSWTEPSHGTLSGTAPMLTYTPKADYHGTDSFTFQVDDGRRLSAPALVSLAVESVNDAPVAFPASHTLDEDGELAITLMAADVDGDALTFEVVQAPAYGQLSGDAPNLSYKPAADFHGTDSFVFRVSDGALSAEATVDLVIQSVGDAPVALSQTVYPSEDSPLEILLAGSSVEGQPLSFEVTGGPDHGHLSGVAPALTYTPEQDWHGTDTLTFVVSTPAGASTPATVTFVVSPVNDAPKARSVNLTSRDGAPVEIVLEAEDVDGDELVFTVVALPEHGLLAGEPPNLTYTPRAGFEGQDAFTFAVSDGLLASEGRVLMGVAAAPPKAPSDGGAAEDGGCSSAGIDATLLLVLGLWMSGRRRSPVGS